MASLPNTKNLQFQGVLENFSDDDSFQIIGATSQHSDVEQKCTLEKKIDQNTKIKACFPKHITMSQAQDKQRILMQREKQDILEDRKKQLQHWQYEQKMQEELSSRQASIFEIQEAILGNQVLIRKKENSFFINWQEQKKFLNQKLAFVEDLLLKNLYIEEQGKLRSYLSQSKSAESNFQKVEKNIEKQIEKLQSDTKEMKQEKEKKQKDIANCYISIVKQLRSQRDEWKTKAECYRRQYFCVNEKDVLIDDQQNFTCDKAARKKEIQNNACNTH